MENQKFLEEFYENVILPKYGESVDVTNIHWIDHGKLDDSYVWAHYFETNGKQYVLLSNDYAAGSHLDDGLSHEIVQCGGENSTELNFNDNQKIENITGRYTLYQEKDHS